MPGFFARLDAGFFAALDAGLFAALDAGFFARLDAGFFAGFLEEGALHASLSWLFPDLLLEGELATGSPEGELATGVLLVTEVIEPLAAVIGAVIEVLVVVVVMVMM